MKGQRCRWGISDVVGLLLLGYWWIFIYFFFNFNANGLLHFSSALMCWVILLLKSCSVSPIALYIPHCIGLHAPDCFCCLGVLSFGWACFCFSVLLGLKNTGMRCSLKILLSFSDTHIWDDNVVFILLPPPGSCGYFNRGPVKVSASYKCILQAMQGPITVVYT